MIGPFDDVGLWTLVVIDIHGSVTVKLTLIWSQLSGNTPPFYENNKGSILTGEKVIYPRRKNVYILNFYAFYPKNKKGGGLFRTTGAGSHWCHKYSTDGA